MGATPSSRTFLIVAMVMIGSITPSVRADIYGIQNAFDANSGSLSPTGIPGPSAGMYQGESTADVAGRRLFLLGASPSPGQSTLTTIALNTGAIAQVNVPGVSPFIEFDPNTVDLRSFGGCDRWDQSSDWRPDAHEHRGTFEYGLGRERI